MLAAYNASGDAATAASTTATNNATTATNLTEVRAGHVHYNVPDAPDLVSVVDTLDPVADGTLTIVAQPDFPRKLQVRIVDGDSSISAGTLTLVGVGASGQDVGQVINLAGGTRTVTTDDAYVTIEAPEVAGVVGAAAGDTISIGVSGALGLPACASPAPANFAVHKVSVDSVDETVGTVDADAGTIAPTTAPDAAKAFDIWFTYEVTPTQAAHTHTQAAHTHAITLS